MRQISSESALAHSELAPFLALPRLEGLHRSKRYCKSTVSEDVKGGSMYFSRAELSQVCCQSATRVWKLCASAVKDWGQNSSMATICFTFPQLHKQPATNDKDNPWSETVSGNCYELWVTFKDPTQRYIIIFNLENLFFTLANSDLRRRHAYTFSSIFPDEAKASGRISLPGEHSASCSRPLACTAYGPVPQAPDGLEEMLSAVRERLFEVVFWLNV